MVTARRAELKTKPKASPMNKPTIFYPQTEAEFWQRQEDAVLAIRETLQKQKVCRLGLAGGETPNISTSYWQRKIFLGNALSSSSSMSVMSSAIILKATRMLREALLKNLTTSENILAFDTSSTRESARRNEPS